MKFLLDTNTCIIYMRGKNISLKQKLESTATKDIAVCSIVKAELFYGAIKSANPERKFIASPEDWQNCTNDVVRFPDILRWFYS